MTVWKTNDWSVNLEDEDYANEPERLLDEAVAAVAQTAPGYFVNLVTPGGCGDPRDWLIAELEQRLKGQSIHFAEIRFIDECGCGGFVTRVYR
ncbi:MAG TPA: CGCGG family rSAM-modified RiPP protein [Bacilli bacterium]